ncbi:MAG: hypothetical protein E7Z70_02100 [Thermoplasmata archaeon]|nr:hypothetical protein [Thermoplasmata archaeon]
MSEVSKRPSNRIYCIRSSSFVDLNRGSACIAYCPASPDCYRNCYTCSFKGEVDPETGAPTPEAIKAAADCVSSLGIAAYGSKRWF